MRNYSGKAKSGRNCTPGFEDASDAGEFTLAVRRSPQIRNFRTTPARIPRLVFSLLPLYFTLAAGTLIAFVSVWPKLGMRSVLTREKECTVPPLSPSPSSHPLPPRPLFLLPSNSSLYVACVLVVAAASAPAVTLYSTVRIHVCTHTHAQRERERERRVNARCTTAFGPNVCDSTDGVAVCTRVREHERTY